MIRYLASSLPTCWRMQRKWVETDGLHVIPRMTFISWRATQICGRFPTALTLYLTEWTCCRWTRSAAARSSTVRKHIEWFRWQTSVHAWPPGVTSHIGEFVIIRSRSSCREHRGIYLLRPSDVCRYAFLFCSCPLWNPHDNSPNGQEKHVRGFVLGCIRKIHSDIVFRQI